MLHIIIYLFFIYTGLTAQNEYIKITYYFSVKNSLLLLCNDDNGGANGIVSRFVINDIDPHAKATKDKPTTIEYFPVFLNEKR